MGSGFGAGWQGWGAAIALGLGVALGSEAIAQDAPADPPSAAERLDLDPEVLEESPVLQRWSQEVPDVMSDIRHDPSFRTRLRLGYSQFPSTNQQGGWNVGVEDVFIHIQLNVLLL